MLTELGNKWILPSPIQHKKKWKFWIFFNVLTFEPHSGHKPVIWPKNTPAGVVFWAVSWDFTKKNPKKRFIHISAIRGLDMMTRQDSTSFFINKGNVQIAKSGGRCLEVEQSQGRPQKGSRAGSWRRIHIKKKSNRCCKTITNINN